ncbi:MAG: hypothetical protein ACJA04_000880, partial [Cellvibrionaceae bacterium]
SIALASVVETRCCVLNADDDFQRHPVKLYTVR